MPARHLVPAIWPQISVEDFLGSLFAERFPGVKVFADPLFVKHILTATYFGERGDSACWISSPWEWESGWYNSALRQLTTHQKTGRDTLAKTEYVARTGFGLHIDEAETPTQEGQEVERNVLLGAASIDGVNNWLFIEQEWKMNGGVVEKEIHLHARPVATEKWDEEDNLSIILPESLF